MAHIVHHTRDKTLVIDTVSVHWVYWQLLWRKQNYCYYYLALQ